MNWYYTIHDSHTYVRVFMNGSYCGDLFFRNDEFKDLYQRHLAMQQATSQGYEIINFTNETKPACPN